MAANAKTVHPGKLLLWFWSMAAGLLLLTAAPAAVLLGILLAPSVATYMLDRSAGRALARITLLFGAAAVVGPLVRLWTAGMGLDTAIELACGPGALAIAWVAQILGILLAAAAPQVVVVLEAQSKLQAARLLAARAVLEAEWGIPPPGEVTI